MNFFFLIPLENFCVFGVWIFFSGLFTTTQMLMHHFPFSVLFCHLFSATRKSLQKKVTGHGKNSAEGTDVNVLVQNTKNVVDQIQFVLQLHTRLDTNKLPAAQISKSRAVRFVIRACYRFVVSMHAYKPQPCTVH